jgi:hypothetical protein
MDREGSKEGRFGKVNSRKTAIGFQVCAELNF